MPEHHVCRWPIGHRLLICGIVAVWMVFAWAGLPLLVHRVKPGPAWFFGTMFLGLTTGTVMVQYCARWRCQPWPRQRVLRARDYALLAALLLRDHR